MISNKKAIEILREQIDQTFSVQEAEVCLMAIEALEKQIVSNCRPTECHYLSRRRRNNVVRGEWKINSDGYYPFCSVCHQEPPGRSMTYFCPNCGADMQGANNGS